MCSYWRSRFLLEPWGMFAILHPRPVTGPDATAARRTRGPSWSAECRDQDDEIGSGDRARDVAAACRDARTPLAVPRRDPDAAALDSSQSLRTTRVVHATLGLRTGGESAAGGLRRAVFVLDQHVPLARTRRGARSGRGVMSPRSGQRVSEATHTRRRGLRRGRGPGAGHGIPGYARGPRGPALPVGATAAAAGASPVGARGNWMDAPLEEPVIEEQDGAAGDDADP